MVPFIMKSAHLENNLCLQVRNYALRVSNSDNLYNPIHKVLHLKKLQDWTKGKKLTSQDLLSSVSTRQQV